MPLLGTQRPQIIKTRPLSELLSASSVKTRRSESPAFLSGVLQEIAPSKSFRLPGRESRSSRLLEAPSMRTKSLAIWSMDKSRFSLTSHGIGLTLGALAGHPVPSTTTKKFTPEIDAQLYEEMVAVAKQNGQPQRYVLERALEFYLHNVV